MSALTTKPMAGLNKSIECTTHGRAEKNAQLSTRGVESYRALQLLSADDIVNQQLAARPPKHSCHTMNHQQNAGMPELDRVRKNKNAHAADTPMYMI